MNIEISKINLINLSNFLASANISMPQIIDIKSDKTLSRGYPPTRFWVHMHQMDTSDIFTFANPIDRILRYSTKDLKWLKSKVDLYIASGITEISGKMLTQESDKQNVLLVNSIQFVHKSMKMTSKSSESEFIKPMEDQTWETFSSTDNHIVIFDLSPDIISKISGLIKIENGDSYSNLKDKSEVIRLHVVSNNQIKFSSREDNKWEVAFDTEDININVNESYIGKVIAYPTSIFNVLDNKLYKSYVVFNNAIEQYAIINAIDENNVLVNLTTEFDPNI